MTQPSAVSERNQPQRIPLALWNRRPVLRRPVSLAMAQWLRVPALWPRPLLPTQQPQAPTVQSLPPPDLDHRRHHLRFHKLALTVWFQAIYLMTQDKKGVSAMKLPAIWASPTTRRGASDTS